MRGMKDAINIAQAFAPGNVQSNEARSLVRMNEELFSQKGFIVGRVFEGKCEADGREDAGVPNVRVYLEDGRYALTDEGGRYHFEGLDPATHTVQLDKLTLPGYLELAPCADRMGHAGRDYSQFAELRPGTLWRSDFVLRQKSAPTGNVQFSFNSALAGGDDALASHQATFKVGGVAAGNSRVLVMLPDGLEYVAGSATVNRVKVTDADSQVTGAGAAVISITDNTLVARLGEVAPGTERVLFETRNSGFWSEIPPVFHTDFTHLDLGAATRLRDNGAKLIGIDYLSIERFKSGNHEVHLALLSHGVVILEGLFLWAVPAGRYELYCLPLRLRSDLGDGAPARAVLRTLD